MNNPIKFFLTAAALLFAFSAVAQQVEIESKNPDVKLKAKEANGKSEFELNNAKATAQGGDAQLSVGAIRIKTEANKDGSPKKISCDTQPTNITVYGQGSALHFTGKCTNISVESTGALIYVDQAKKVTVLNSGNNVIVSKIDAGSVQGTGNMLQWRNPYTVKIAKVGSTGITNAAMRLQADQEPAGVPEMFKLEDF
jgi:hypothetical protein